MLQERHLWSWLMLVNILCIDSVVVQTMLKKNYLLGSNHGLFSLVAGASGAHTIAFEPQTHLRSKEERIEKKEE
jgi:hypothetical protein